MIGCLRTHVHEQPIIVLYFEFKTVLKFYNLKAWLNSNTSGEISLSYMDRLRMDYFLHFCGHFVEKYREHKQKY